MYPCWPESGLSLRATLNTPYLLSTHHTILYFTTSVQLKIVNGPRIPPPHSDLGAAARGVVVEDMDRARGPTNNNFSETLPVPHTYPSKSAIFTM